MRLECIKSFIGVVNARSFSKAAKNLYISQPTISTHIKQLEEELGVQLLVRSTKDVLPSEEGRTFYPYALRLVETEEEAMKCLRRETGEKKRIVQIAVSNGYGCYILPKFLSVAREKLGDISFRIMEGDSEYVMMRLRDYEADIAICGTCGKGRAYKSELLFQDEIVLITPNVPSYQNLKGVFPMDLLKNEWFVTQTPSPEMRWFSEAVSKVFSGNSITPHIAVTVESTEMVRRAVEEGNGVAFISRVAAKEALQQNRILQFTFSDPGLRHDVYLTFRQDKAPGKPVLQTAELMKNVLKEQEL